MDIIRQVIKSLGFFDAQSNRSNSFISSPSWGILNENWYKIIIQKLEELDIQKLEEIDTHSVIPEYDYPQCNRPKDYYAWIKETEDSAEQKV
jgi:hypothetical protein